MKTTRFIALALAASVLAPVIAFAQEGPLMIRARGVYISTADKSDAIPALAVPADAITVSKKLIPEVDITYFFNKNLAAELILTYPQQHDVEVAGAKIGTFKHLPPVLSLQYHFAPDGMVRPFPERRSQVRRVAVGRAAQGGRDEGQPREAGPLVDRCWLRLPLLTDVSTLRRGRSDHRSGAAPRARTQSPSRVSEIMKSTTALKS